MAVRVFGSQSLMVLSQDPVTYSFLSSGITEMALPFGGLGFRV